HETLEEIENIPPAPFNFETYHSNMIEYVKSQGMSEIPRTAELGLSELRALSELIAAADYSGRVKIDPSVVRGLEYYTGPVFEVELTFPISGDDGQPVRFGSVGGGGRYDGLVSRFRNEPVPSTGFSVGVSRLLAALVHLKKIDTRAERGPVV